MNLPGGEPAAEPKKQEPAKKQARASARYQAIQFNGTALEYFMVWIVSLLLTFITIGIYGTWAKVRRINFFYNNTSIHGYGIGYHATGGQLFKGRLLALVFLIIANVIASLDVALMIFILAVFFFIMPWALNRSLRFSARNTSWRNVRLQWHGGYGGAFMIVYVVPLVSIISLGFLAPLMTRYFFNHYANNHTFGTTPFEAELETGQAYGAFFIALISALLATAALAVPMYFLNGVEIPGVGVVNLMGEGMVYLVALFFFIFNTVNLSLCRNYLLQSLRLGGIARFDSQISPVTLAWIQASNTVVILLTLGLMIPWAAVRRYEYLASVTEYKITGDINRFVDEEHHKQSAFGEEFVEMEGLEFGI